MLWLRFPVVETTGYKEERAKVVETTGYKEGACAWVAGVCGGDKPTRVLFRTLSPRGGGDRSERSDAVVSGVDGRVSVIRRMFPGKEIRKIKNFK